MFTAEDEVGWGGMGLVLGGSTPSKCGRGDLYPLVLTTVVHTFLSPLWALSALVSQVGPVLSPVEEQPGLTEVLWASPSAVGRAPVVAAVTLIRGNGSFSHHLTLQEGKQAPRFYHAPWQLAV